MADVSTWVPNALLADGLYVLQPSVLGWRTFPRRRRRAGWLPCRSTADRTLRDDVGSAGV